MASRTEKDLPEETTVKGTSNVNLLDSWPPATIFRSRKMSFKLPLKPEPSASERALNSLHCDAGSYSQSEAWTDDHPHR